MTTRASLNTKLAEETYFKPLDGGYLFEAPNPWLFGPGRRYIVGDEQKQALLGIMRARHPRLRVVLICAGVLVFTCGVSLLWWALSPREEPGPFELFGMAVTLLVPLYLAILVAVRCYLRRIAPIVSVAVPSEARVTYGERSRAIGNSMSTKLLLLLAAVPVLDAIVGAISIATGSGTQPRLDVHSLYLAIFPVIATLPLGVFAMYSLYKRFRRSR